ncbi:hypothetical protein FRB93_009323 [Tulasnella sp. JGI-2019a]|nr:hypothetical protein FRB93_009323 [Tulasnella sp. JGI-2019a]
MDSARVGSYVAEMPEEMLSNIFENLASCDLASVARVCSQWSEIALDRLWYSMDSLLPILHLLEPTTISNGKIDIPQGLEHVNWDRFGLYARRIRCLSWADDGVIKNHLCVQLLLHQPVLLPNLLELTWEARRQEAVMQMFLVASSSLRTLRLNLECYDIGKLRPVIKGFNIRSIHLSNFEFRNSGPVDVKEGVAELIRSQPTLRCVSLPFFYGTSEIVTALGSLEKLEVVGVTEWNTSDGHDTEWCFLPGQFPMLSELGFSANSLRDATGIFVAHSLPQLRSVTVGTFNTPPDHPSLKVFLSALVSSCPHLSKVCLVIYLDEESPYEAPEDSLEPVTFSTLEPLFQYKGLTSLEIYHNYPIVLGVEEISKIAQSWPGLRHLHLAPDPIRDLVEDNLIGTPLSLLVTFATHGFLNLHHLGLFFNVECTTTLNMPRLSTFPGLRTLAVGRSQVPSVDRVATASFLSLLVDPGLSIEAGYSRHAKYHVECDDEDQLRAWKDVERLVHENHTMARSRV